MARFCFYCGRELKTGEKCQCRYQKSSGATQGEKPSSSENASSASSPQSAKKKAWGTKHKKSAKKNRDQQKSGQDQTASARTHRQTGSTTSGPHAKWQPRGSKTGDFTSRAKTGRSFGKILLQYFLHPAEQIRLTAQAQTREPTLSLIFLQSFAAGLLLLYAAEHPFLRMVFGLNIVSAQQGGTAISRVFLLVQGMGLFLSCYLLHALLYHLLLRYVFRQATAYLRLVSALSSSCFFSTLFMLIGLFLMAGSFFSSLFLVALAFAFALIVQTIALRFITGLDESRVLILVALTAFIFTGIIAMLFSLSLPVLSALLEQSIII